MIKFIFQNDKNQTSLGMGISRENVRRMEKDNPILFNLRDMAPNLIVDGDVLIFFKETQQELEAMMVDKISPDTKVILDEKLYE